MAKKKLTTFDPAEGLTSSEAIAAFITDAFESGLCVEFNRDCRCGASNDKTAAGIS